MTDDERGDGRDEAGSDRPYRPSQPAGRGSGAPRGGQGRPAGGFNRGGYGRPGGARPAGGGGGRSFGGGGDRSVGGGYDRERGAGGGDRRSFGDRPGGGAGGRPAYGDRPYGDRPYGTGRGTGGGSERGGERGERGGFGREGGGGRFERDDRGGGFNRDNRGGGYGQARGGGGYDRGRPGGGGSSFERRDRPAGGGGFERGRPPAGGDRPQRPWSDRPPRPFDRGERGGGAFGDRPREGNWDANRGAPDREPRPFRSPDEEAPRRFGGAPRPGFSGPRDSAERRPFADRSFTDRPPDDRGDVPGNAGEGRERERFDDARPSYRSGPRVGDRAPWRGGPGADRPRYGADRARPSDGDQRRGEAFASPESLADDEELVAGRRPVAEAFAARRPAKRLLVVPERRQALEQLVLHATALRIPVVEVEGGTLTSVSGFDGHQGIALVVEPRRWASLDDVLARAAERGEPPLILVLDSLEDPQNVGTLLRTAEANGVHGVIFPTRRSAPISPAAIKTSAGATEHLLLVPLDDLAGGLVDLRSRGLRVVGADEDAQLSYRDADLRGPLALVVGSEGQGISGVVHRRLDLAVRIPMRGKIASLNAAVAGSVLLFEAASQRGLGETDRATTAETRALLVERAAGAATEPASTRDEASGPATEDSAPAGEASSPADEGAVRAEEAASPSEDLDAPAATPSPSGGQLGVAETDALGGAPAERVATAETAKPKRTRKSRSDPPAETAPDPAGAIDAAEAPAPVVEVPEKPKRARRPKSAATTPRDASVPQATGESEDDLLPEAGALPERTAD